jgi:hypothetical protein
MKKLEMFFVIFILSNTYIFGETCLKEPIDNFKGNTNNNRVPLTSTVEKVKYSMCRIEIREEAEIGLLSGVLISTKHILTTMHGFEKTKWPNGVPKAENVTVVFNYIAGTIKVQTFLPRPFDVNGNRCPDYRDFIL